MTGYDAKLVGGICDGTLMRIRFPHERIRIPIVGLDGIGAIKYRLNSEDNGVLVYVPDTGKQETWRDRPPML